MHIPGYKIERLIAEGGMSSVYLATQESLDRHVVIKLLKRFDRPQRAQRFLHEAKVIASLQHQHVVTIYDVGTVGERYYIAMEYLEGGSLADRIEEGISPKMALDLLENLAGCLDFLHRHHVVHRDIKPSNVLFHADGSLRLTDFGIAVRLDEERDVVSAGSRFGSPYYLSPEQVEDWPVDARSDIYSLGVVFYQMLSGKRPYEAASPAETIVAHLSQPIPLLPEDLHSYQGLCEQMLAKKPEDRVESARNLVELIHGVRALQPGHVAGSRLRARHAGFPLSGKASAAALGILAVSIGILWWPGDHGSAQQAVPRLAVPAPAPAPALVPDINAISVIAGPVGTAAVDQPVVDTESEVAVPAEISVERKPPALAAADPVSAETAELGALSTSDGVSPVGTEIAVPVVVEESHAADASRVLAQSEDRPVDAWLKAGNEALGRDRLTTPGYDNAYTHYKKVLAHAPGNADALSGIERIADRYAVLARRSLAAGDLRQARLYLERGTDILPKHTGLHAVSAELAMAERPPEPIRVARIEPKRSSAKPTAVTVIEFEGTSVTSRSTAGSDNIAKDLGRMWRSVWD
jgi:serine/threonine-protein kinase PpkA